MTACSPNPNAGGVADFGTVTGIAADAKTQAPLAQFTVSIGGQSRSFSPADTGKYRVDHIPIGTQTLTIYAIGYQTYNQPGVVVLKDQTTPIPAVGLVSSTGL